MSRSCLLLVAIGLVLQAQLAHSESWQETSFGRQLVSLGSCQAISFNPLVATKTHAPVQDLQWVGAEDLTVFAITQQAISDAGGAWRSQDGGSNFVELTPKLASSIQGSNESVNVMSVYSQKSKPENVLFMGTGTYSWLSHDAGETFKAIQTPTKWKGSGIKAARVHPHHDDWLLVLVKRPTCKTLDSVQMECPHDLMLSKSLYSDTPSWINITADSKSQIAGFVDFDWVANLCPSKDCKGLENINEDGIFATMYVHPGDYDQPWDPDVHFVVSNDFFNTFQTHVRCGNMFELVGHSVYLAFANSCPTDISGNSKKGASAFPRGITLYTSIDGGNNFVQACLPVALKQEGYELMETHDGKGAVIIVDYVVNTGFMDLQASSVYLAGPHHALFSMSMTDVFHADFGFSTDFARIEAIPGMYIANQMLPRPSDDATAVDYYYDLSDTTGMPLVESRITFNSGGKWNRIPAPLHIDTPACDRCAGKSECYLHLHGFSSWDSFGTSLPSIYSNPSAPGIIMGTGNVGPVGQGLDDNDGLCTWLSSDGGVSWREVAEGAWIYEYADWGSTIVMARHPGVKGAAADEIRFSTDNGHCWQSVPLSEALIVDNIRIEPDGQRPRVIVHGHSCRDDVNPKCGLKKNDTTRVAAEGLMYVVDVQLLMSGRLGGCVPSDYVMWTVPTPFNTPRCVLGQEMRIQRRKDESMCLNGPDYIRPAALNTTCNCTADDIECDYGYQRDPSNTKCVAISKDRMPECPVVANGEYSVSTTGKRLVHGEHCTHVENIIPDANQPGGKTDGGGKKAVHHSGWFKFLMFLLVTGVLGGLFVAWWRFMASDAQQDTVRDIAASVVAFFASLWGWIVDKVRPGHRNAGEEMGYFQPLGDPDVEGRSNIFTLK